MLCKRNAALVICKEKKWIRVEQQAQLNQNRVVAFSIYQATDEKMRAKEQARILE
jgi:hypothetical protein